MRPQTRGWIMPEADMRSMLKFIDEKIRLAEIETRHRDALIRLREILENDLNDLSRGRSSSKQINDQEAA
jgi:hypothetical protein